MLVDVYPFSYNEIYVFLFQTNFGSEFISPGKSSLELLIDFYIDLTKQPLADEAQPLW